MGRAPYKPAKEGVGALLCVSTFNHKRAAMYAYSDPLLSSLLKNRII